MTEQNEQPNFNGDLEKDSQLKLHEEHQSQRDAANEPSNSAVVNVEPKAITNIYYDCLKRIFDFLDLKSLLNVARTCKRLQIAAAAKFGDDYSKKGIMFNTDEFYENEIREEIIYKIGFPIALPFLRCFGSKISKLLLTNDNYGSKPRNKQENRLCQYINRYCANTLSSIDLFGNWTISNQVFPMQFVNVGTVIISGMIAGHNANLPDIRNCFPNIRRLEMHGYFGDDFSSILQDNHDIVSFPHLTHLVLGRFTIENAVNLLHANRQLQHLKLYSQTRTQITFDQLLHMVDGNSSILRLEISSMITDINEVNFQRLLIQCPLIEELLFANSPMTFTSDQAFVLINQISSLKRFEFVMNNRSEYDHLVSRLDNTWNHSFLYFKSVNSAGKRACFLERKL